MPNKLKNDAIHMQTKMHHPTMHVAHSHACLHPRQPRVNINGMVLKLPIHGQNTACDQENGLNFLQISNRSHKSAV